MSDWRVRSITCCSDSSLYWPGYRRWLYWAMPVLSTSVKLKLPLRAAWIRQSKGAKAWVRVLMAFWIWC